MTAGRFSYNPALDGVRALAVIAVMLNHTELPFAKRSGAGVDVFFVLSGFLITSLLLAEWAGRDRIDLSRFYQRRLLRLYPALLLLLTVTVLVLPLLIRVRMPTSFGVASILFYFSNWDWTITRSTTELGYLDHLWSLAVEEQFYLVWPAVMIVLLRRRHAFRNLLIVALVVAALSVLARVPIQLSGDPLGFRLRGTDANADQLMYGCGLAVLVARYPEQLKVVLQRGALPALALLVLLAGPWLAGNPPVVLLYVRGVASLATFGLASAFVIGYLHFATPQSILVRVMSFGPVVLIGRISYGLYLWHFPVFTIVQGVYHSRHPGLWELLLEFALSFGVATLSFVLLESPLLRLKDRLRPLVAQPPAVTAVHEPA